MEWISCTVPAAIRANWLEITKILGAGIVFGIGLWQYTKAQRWKRVEFVAAEMRIFFDDEAARAAMIMLDWRQKAMALYKFRGEGDMEKELVTYATVAESLGTAPDTHYTKVQSAIREIFERFIEFLARFEGFIEAGVIEENDLTPYLDYWVKLLAGADEHSPQVTQEVLPQLWKFINFYGYKDIPRFVARYEKIKPEFMP
jgi:hypothetical protein